MKEFTRMRGDAAGSTLNFVITNVDSVIKEIKVQRPLGKSDQAYISFVCDTKDLEHTCDKVVYLYEKVNYLQMKQRLNINWNDFLGTRTDTETKRVKFKDKMQEVICECVLRRESECVYDNKKRTNNSLPVNKRSWRKIKRKQRLWETLKHMKQEHKQATAPGRKYADVV